MQELDFKSILNAFASPILVAKPVRLENKIIDFEGLYLNDAFLKKVNYAVEGCKFFSEFKNRLSPEVQWFDIAKRTINGEQIEPFTYYSTLGQAWFRIQMHSIDDILVVSIENVTEETNNSQKLREMSLYDTLTALPNRNKFKEDFTEFTDISQNENSRMALLLIDIDNMKMINDSKGHQQGDRLLQQAAMLLRNFERETIHSYRYGDDEFMVVIEKADSLNTITNITDAIFESFMIEEISVSGGISVFPDNSKLCDDLLRFTDIAIHHAKKNGKNKFIYFKPDMQRVFIQKLNMQTKMTAAVLASDFYLVYQPQFVIKTNKLRGFEALIRWHDKELGDIPPSVFIPLAEETGLILPIGTWIMNTAFSTLKKWQTQYGFAGILSINISPLQLREESFIPNLKNALERYKLPPASVEIEITEGVMINNMDDAIEKLKTVKNMGLRISLDDFGTGYSSLSYLQMLPLDTLKIDKSFINTITAKDGIQANITNSIIMMVSKMGLETIAEGVEKGNQLNLLKEFNCNIVQGFLRGKPMQESLCNAYLAGNESALISLSDGESAL